MSTDYGEVLATGMVSRKLKAGEPVPTLISEDAKAGRLDVPFTNAGKK